MSIIFIVLPLFFHFHGTYAEAPVYIEYMYPTISVSSLLYIKSYGTFLQSRNGNFEGQVYKPGTQQTRLYLSVLHVPTGTVVWTANRNEPMPDRESRVNLTPEGLMVGYSNGDVLWSTPSFKSNVSALRLLDTGNLVLLDMTNNTLWQSFDHPTDTLISGQLLPAGLYLSSSVASDSDLSQGDYRLDVTSNDALLNWMGSSYWQFSNETSTVKNRDASVAVALMASNDSGIYLLAPNGDVVFQIPLPVAPFRIIQLGSDGQLKIKSYPAANSSNSLANVFVAPRDSCDLPLSCGPLGLCSLSGNSSSCSCPPQFGSSVQSSGCTPNEGLPTRFTCEQVEEITSNFQTKIGSGGFGSVYKGELTDKSEVAVKKIEGVGVQGRKEFCTEIAVIGNIHHVNLVRLRGYCAESSHRLLIYEYMNRGSIDQSLFRLTDKLLNWSERMNVAIGVARGIAYLHSCCQPKILHCDIKPENILLNDDGHVKIADFGLAKLITPEQSVLFTTMRGTRGYLAPEWIMNAAISDRSDVYSFGMVLLELVRGRKNRYEPVSVDAQPKWSTTTGGSSVTGCEYFPSVALEMHVKKCYEELADPRLEGNIVVREVERVVKTALCCLHEEPALRPNMTSVVAMLEGTMDVWEPRIESLGFLRKYGGCRHGSSSGGGTIDIEDELTKMSKIIGGSNVTSNANSGCPSITSTHELSGPR
ncbi:G-type lectin S-receptor-like serine/threonine-protein kinase At5g35370 isoform X2 [Carex rostrata]